MNLEKKVEELKARADVILPQMKELKADVDILSKEGLSVDNKMAEEIEKIKNELGISPAEAIRVGTWPGSGPGSSACYHCTAGGGA